MIILITLFLKTRVKELQISEHIWKLEFNLFLLIISIWIVKKGKDVFLIDSGIGNMGLIASESASKKGNFKGVILTHGHKDHAGGINKIHLRYHELDLYMNGEDYIYTVGEKPFPGRKHVEKIISPNISINDLSNIDPDNFFERTGLIPIYTPGHSPGHTAFYHNQDNVLIAGDLFVEKKGILDPPIKRYTADMNQAILSEKSALRDANPKIISVCHGRNVEAPFILKR